MDPRFTASDRDYTAPMAVGISVAGICIIIVLRRFCTMHIREDVEAPTATIRRSVHREHVFGELEAKKQQVSFYGEDSILGKQFSMPALLKPPAAITEQGGTVIKNACLALLDSQDIALDDFNPEVFICFDAGYRDGNDVEPMGPGVFYAAALTKFLYEHGVPCYSSVMLPRGKNQSNYSSDIKRRFSKCRVLILVETAAVYGSLQCLKEIHSAVTSKMEILPLRFEIDLPENDDQWVNRGRAEDSMRTAVQKKLPSINRIPEPPGTIPSSPGTLDRMFTMLSSAVKESTVKTLARSETNLSLASSPSWSRAKPPKRQILTDDDDDFAVEDDVPLVSVQEEPIDFGSRMSEPREVVAPSSPAKFCPECGTAFEGAKFCPECGTKRDVAALSVPKKKNVRKVPSDEGSRSKPKVPTNAGSGGSSRSDPLPGGSKLKAPGEAGRGLAGSNATPVSRRALAKETSKLRVAGDAVKASVRLQSRPNGAAVIGNRA